MQIRATSLVPWRYLSLSFPTCRESDVGQNANQGFISIKLRKPTTEAHFKVIGLWS